MPNTWLASMNRTRRSTWIESRTRHHLAMRHRECGPWTEETEDRRDCGKGSDLPFSIHHIMTPFNRSTTLLSGLEHPVVPT
jgi:hypothetical protein